MTPSQFQLLDYWVDSIQVRTNKKFDPEKSPEMDFDWIEVKHKVERLPSPDGLSEETGSLWSITLEIEQKILPGKNIPYAFDLSMNGVVAVHPSFEKEKLKQYIEINGPTLLFGAAREIIRAATGRGQHGPVIIPSTRFTGSSTKPKTKKKAAAKKTARKYSTKT